MADALHALIEVAAQTLFVAPLAFCIGSLAIWVGERTPAGSAAVLAGVLASAMAVLVVLAYLVAPGSAGALNDFLRAASLGGVALTYGFEGLGGLAWVLLPDVPRDELDGVGASGL